MTLNRSNLQIATVLLVCITISAWAITKINFWQLDPISSGSETLKTIGGNLMKSSQLPHRQLHEMLSFLSRFSTRTTISPPRLSQIHEVT